MAGVAEIGDELGSLADEFRTVEEADPEGEAFTIRRRLKEK